MMRKEKLLQTVSLFMIELMILLPVYVAAQAAPAGNTTVPPSIAAATITATAPLWINKNYVDVKGNTMPNAKLEYYVGPTKVKLGRSIADGSFYTKDVPLIKKGKNDLIIKSITDTQTAETKLEVNVDTTPPILNISDIPPIATSKSITVKGDVSEEVRIYYSSYAVKDEQPPDDVKGLEARQVQKNQVSLLWTPSIDTDFLEYAVYRNDKRIGTTRTPTFIDLTPASGKTYKYAVSAVDDSCNEGPKSVPVTAQTPAGGSLNETTKETELSCKPVYKHLDTYMPFNLTFDLSPIGKTVIIIKTEDKAGNTVEIKKETTFDATPPQFLWTNLDQMGTTYIPDITIKGNLSEKATVFVYINGKPTDSFEVSDDKGYFEIKVSLKSDVEKDTGQTAGLNTGVGWENKIALKAVDLANKESWYPGPSQTTEVIWAQCGFGSWVSFDPETITPSIVTPRLLLQGVQQIGIPFKMRYTGGQQEASIGQINVVPVRLSPDLAEWYDNDKIEAPVVFIAPSGPEMPVKEWVGYVQINFAKFPLEKLELKANATETGQEIGISKWRQGEVIPKAGLQESGARGFYFVTGCPSAFGCMRFYLEVDIPVREKITVREPYTTKEKVEWVQRRQRACLPITVEIDQVIPPDVIPEGLLKSSSDFLQKTIDAIDKLLDPLTQVTQFLMYSCAGSAAVLFLADIAKGIGCIGLEAKGASKEVAAAGLCELYDDTTEDSDGAKAKRACKTCREFIATYNSIKETVYQPICDRIGCPNAPTLQKYIKDSKNEAIDLTIEINKGTAKGVITAKTLDDAKSKYAVGGKLWGGNSCAFSDLNTKKDLQKISLGYTIGPAIVPESFITELPPNVIEQERMTATHAEDAGTPTAVGILPFMTGAAVANAIPDGGTAAAETPAIAKEIPRVGIKELYELYKTPSTDYEFCNDLTHPAHPYCCGKEYVDEWNSACGIGNMLGSAAKGINIDTYSEIRQSTGLAAQRAGRAKDYAEYSNIFNFISGFCSSSGEAKPEMIRTDLSFDPIRSYSEENMVYMFVEPTTSTKEEYGEKFLYRVYAGYIGKDYEIVAMNSTEREKFKIKDEKIKVLAKGQLDIIEIADFTDNFKGIGTDKETAGRNLFISTFCQKLDTKTNPICNNMKAEAIYKKVTGYIGTTDQEYIVKPSSGLWTAVQCICLPAVVGYLEHWRAITLVVKQCFDSILVTGDYSSGICRAVLSRYVCDLLWEIISCFVNVWTKPGGVRAKTGVFGEVLGAITEAGSNTAGEVRGRYGETATFNAIFNEQQLVHGLCFMAFGLDYNLDITALTRASIEATTTEPPPVLFEICDKRFLGFNPATSPKGLTTWEYHFGILAMAVQPTNIRLELVCDQGFNCNSDEYAFGECDCNRNPTGLGRTTIRPTSDACPGWKDRLTKGEMLNVDCYHMQQAQNYRYNKAIFTMEWQDPATKKPEKIEKECNINQIGTAPFFCKFDTFSLSYRCLFGEEPSGIRIIKIDPDYKKKALDNTTPIFGIGERMAFNMDLQQVIPEDPAERDKGTKFVTYSIKNNAGDVVASLDPTTSQMDAKLYELKTNGFYTKRIETMELVSEEKFGKGKGITGLPYGIQGWSNNTALNAKINLEANRYITNVEIKYSKSGVPAQMPSTNQFVIDINQSAGKSMFNVYLAQGIAPGRILTNAIRMNAMQGSNTQELKEGTYAYEHIDSAKNESFEARFRINQTSPINPSDHAQFTITPRPGTTEDPCVSKKPTTWTATFTILNADKYGQPTEQKAYDPKTGEIQEKTIAFQVVCVHQDELPPITVAAPAAGQPTVTPPGATPTVTPPAAAPGTAPAPLAVPTELNITLTNETYAEVLKEKINNNSIFYIFDEDQYYTLRVSAPSNAAKVKVIDDKHLFNVDTYDFSVHMPWNLIGSTYGWRLINQSNIVTITDNTSKILEEAKASYRGINCSELTNCVDYTSYGQFICNLDPCKAWNAPCSWNPSVNMCLGTMGTTIPPQAATTAVINDVLLAPSTGTNKDILLPKFGLATGISTTKILADTQYLLYVNTSRQANVTCKIVNGTGTIVSEYTLAQAYDTTSTTQLKVGKNEYILMCGIRDTYWLTQKVYNLLASDKLSDIFTAINFIDFTDCVTKITAAWSTTEAKKTCPYLNFNFINIDGCARELKAAWDASTAADICLDKFNFSKATDPYDECIQTVSRIWSGSALYNAQVKCYKQYYLG